MRLLNARLPQVHRRRSTRHRSRSVDGETTVRVRRARHEYPLQGIVYILLAAACFALLDATAHGLSQPEGRWHVPVLLIITVRYTVQALVMAGVLARQGRAGFASPRPLFQLLRGGLLLITSFCSFFGVRYMPVPYLSTRQSACSRHCW